MKKSYRSWLVLLDAIDHTESARRYPGKFIPPETEDGRAVASFLLDCMHQHLQQKEKP